MNPRLLGAVLAGGSARRFGTDKALAIVGGEPMIARSWAALAVDCGHMALVGRYHADWPVLKDRPGPGLGPLAGLNAALHHAAALGLDAVLTAPCDMPGLPADLPAILGAGPAVLADHPVVGMWPASLAPQLDAWLAAGRRSMRGFADAVGARPIRLDAPLANINTPADMARWEADQSRSPPSRSDCGGGSDGRLG
jgi:molybdenum cofactor guanylyltransferase